MAIPITGIILTKNEEADLSICLELISWADEILIVDSFSTDRTAEIAQASCARFIQHPVLNCAAQCNFAQSAAIFNLGGGRQNSISILGAFDAVR